MTDILKLFGDRVKEIRKDQGLSQEKLAEKAGLHHTYIGGVERGERNLSLKNIGKIAHALNKAPENIFFEKGRGFFVSEKSEEKLYISNEMNTLPTLDQELLEYFHSLRNDELKNCIVNMLKIVSKKK